MRIGIMQPYFFPFIGYFQLINAVDKFVLYDDVNFIKRGWINRNVILVNSEKKYITINLDKPSQNKKIHEISVKGGGKKILKTIELNYSKAPYFKTVYEIIEDVISYAAYPYSISLVAGKSIKKVCEYLNLNTIIEYSSEMYFDTRKLKGADRLIEITKRNGAYTYINATGGKSLYTKRYFKDKGVYLKFINNNIDEYKQFKNEFIPYLSIIDVMMFNTPNQIRKMLGNYKLE